jgi:transposase
MKLIRVGVDLAKNVFQMHGVDRSEKAVWRRKLVRGDWLKALLTQIEPGCEIGMEACSGAHHWARMLQAQGYTVKLIAPQFVKPYVKSNKNDANDAEAICEAMSRPSMRFVPIKNVEQLDIQAVHRVRASLIDHLRLLVVSLLALGRRRAVALHPLVQAVRAYAQPRSDLGGRMAAFGYLLDCFDLEFFGIPLAAHTFSLNLQL